MRIRPWPLQLVAVGHVAAPLLVLALLAACGDSTERGGTSPRAAKFLGVWLHENPESGGLMALALNAEHRARLYLWVPGHGARDIARGEWYLDDSVTVGVRWEAGEDGPASTAFVRYHYDGTPHGALSIGNVALVYSDTLSRAAGFRP
jgi:hypothetical protein